MNLINIYIKGLVGILNLLLVKLK